MSVKTPKMEELLKQREKLEGDMNALVDFLNQAGVGVNGSLLDKDGFPRDDLDLYAIRESRGRIARMQNDHKSLMKNIEEEMFSIHENGPKVSIPVKKGSSSASSINSANDTYKLQLRVGPAFAEIDQVSEGSPAAAAGLRVGDQVKRFGSIDLLAYDNVGACFADLKNEVVSGRQVELVVENKYGGESDNDHAVTAGSNSAASASAESGGAVAVGVETSADVNMGGSGNGGSGHSGSGGGERTVLLEPKPWDGAGLLGCHIVPIAI